MGASWLCTQTRPSAPSTCLYLAGRLHPQACSLPSSLRTCSRTWRYCSRFCSRRAEEVQSLSERNDRLHLFKVSRLCEAGAPRLSLVFWWSVPRLILPLPFLRQGVLFDRRWLFPIMGCDPVLKRSFPAVIGPALLWAATV